MGLLSSLRDRFVDDEDAEHMRVAESPEGIAAAIARDYRQEPIPTDPHGYLYGPLAQGLALSAPMVVANDAAWNSLTDVGSADVKYFMSEVWGITDREDWMERLNALVNGQYGDSVAYHAAIVRTRVRTVRDQPRVSDADWAAALRDEAARVEAPTAYADALCATIPAIHAAEQTLRQAHLLGADEEVVALDGYDYLRAGNIARWGVHLGFGSSDIAANVAIACRDSASQLYGNWREYALGVLAGRIVTYPESWGRHVTCGIEMMRPFLDSINSPWTNIPFPDEPVMVDDE